MMGCRAGCCPQLSRWQAGLLGLVEGLLQGRAGARSFLRGKDGCCQVDVVLPRSISASIHALPLGCVHFPTSHFTGGLLGRIATGSLPLSSISSTYRTPTQTGLALVGHFGLRTGFSLDLSCSATFDFTPNLFTRESKFACGAAGFIEEDLDEATRARQEDPGDFVEDDDEFGDFIDDDTGAPGEQPRRRRRPSGAPPGVDANAMRVGLGSWCSLCRVSE